MTIVIDQLEPGALRSLVCDLCGGAAGWSVASSYDSWWIRVRNARARPPDQGWKLHVSAAPHSVVEILSRIVPILLAEDADFKVIASDARLRSLNQGDAGLSQIGKCVTVYPNDERQAVRLALALDRATRGLRGPAIPSDRPLRPGSLVHYRYGSFAERLMQLPNGRIEWAMLRPDGALIPDRRSVGYAPPDWASDPFIAAGIAHTPAPPDPLIDGRYVVLETLAQSARGTVARALDLRELRRCILKRAVRDAMLSRHGHDARDRLRYEAAVLARLADLPVPQVFDLFAWDDDLILVLEDLPGEPLDQRVGRLAREVCTLPEAELIALGGALAAILHAIHELGYVYRDLKPSNVIMEADGGVRLIDVELAYDLRAEVPPLTSGGTRGYMSPQQDAGAAPTIADDVYSLGALLYVAATGAEPGFTPQPHAPLSRPLALLSPSLHPDLAALIARCLSPNPTHRPASMLDVQQALAAISAGSDAPSTPMAARSSLVIPSRRHFRSLARRLGDSLIAAARTSGNAGPVWESTLYHGSGIWSRDLYDGSAGVLLVLAALVAEFGGAEQIALLRQGASALQAAPRPGGAPLAGLYFGEAGVALALLRAGQVLGDPQLIADANQRGHQLAALPDGGPDLTTGLAGRIRLHLLLWDQTADVEQLAHAVAAGTRLLALAERHDDELCWRMPSGYGSLSGKTLLGYAHGAAGVGDALLDLYAATGDDDLRIAAHAAARWIIRQALPALNDRSGVVWPKQPGGEPSRGFWCHGAAGIGRFLLHVAQVGGIDETAVYAERAARTVAQARWAGPTQCHGLAGNIELLLDMFQATGSTAYLDDAHTLAALLDAFLVERDGRLVCQSELPDVFTPDLMLGYGGVILCLLRLADPESRPHHLSRAGLREGAQPRPTGSTRFPQPDRSKTA